MEVLTASTVRPLVVVSVLSSYIFFNVLKPVFPPAETIPNPSIVLSVYVSAAVRVSASLASIAYLLYVITSSINPIVAY